MRGSKSPEQQVTKEVLAKTGAKQQRELCFAQTESFLVVSQKTAKGEKEIPAKTIYKSGPFWSPLDSKLGPPSKGE